MTIGKIRVDMIIGLLLGLLVSNQSIRAILHFNPVWLLFSLLFPLVVVNWLALQKKKLCYR